MLAQKIIKDVLSAYDSHDAQKALAAWHSDEEVDETYSGLFRELLTHMMEDPRNIGACTHMLFIAKNIERIGDHATNIAEIIYYMVVGEPLDAARPKGDITSSIPRCRRRLPAERCAPALIPLLAFAILGQAEIILKQNCVAGINPVTERK